MGNIETWLKENVAPILGKALIWIAYISIGVIVKLSLYNKTDRLNWKKAAIAIVLSICAGALASIACTNFGISKWGALIVPTSTIIGQGVFEYIIANWSKVADFFLSKFTKSNGNK